MRARVFTIIAVALGLGVVAFPVLGQTIRFMPIGEVPEGVTLSVLTDDQDVTADPIAAVVEDGKRTWIYSVGPKPGQWRTEPIVIITVPERTLPSTRVVAKMALELAFSFKATQADETFDVPIELFQETGKRMRDELDAMDRQPYRQFEQILMAEGLAWRYLKELPVAQSDVTQFAVKKWFDVIYRAVEERQRPLRVHSPVLDTVRLVFRDSPQKLGYFEEMTVRLRSLSWQDAAELGGLLTDGDCATARSLLDYLTKQNELFDGDAERRRIVDADGHLRGLEADYGVECDPPGAGEGDPR